MSQRYQRIRQLGQGGMGVVYEVFDSVKNRRIAQKSLRFDDPDLLFRLKREFRSLAHISHHNLVELYDLFADESTCFYTMELIDGVDFLENCRSRGKGPLPFDEVRLRDALSQLYQGVATLHAAGKIHRDIKPSNVLVARNGRVVLLDFGLVSDLADTTNLTLTAHVAGTALYMAPEQGGSGSGVNEAADWYSVGVVLFEALTGQRPFDGSVIQVLRDKAHKPAPDPRSFTPGLPADLADLCLALLATDPSRRPTREQIAAVLHPKGDSAPEARQRRARSAPVFSGRGEELRALDEEFERVLSGACRLVMIQGPSGIGKTALIRQFLDRASSRSSNAVLLGGRCYPREAIPYKAVDGLIDQLSEYWRRLSRADAMYLLPREPEYLTLAFPVLKRVEELTEHALPVVLEPQEARSRAVIALRETLQRLCRRGPLVLFLDDMQWVDADSTRLLRAIADSADAPALLLVMGSRPIPDGDPVNELVAPLLARARRIQLGPLSPEETRDLIRGISSSMTEQAALDLARDAAGSPFFAEALARQADLGPARDRIDLDALLRQQIAGRSELGRRILSLASVAGQPVSVKLAAAASGSEPELVASELRTLHAESLTRDAGGTAVDQFEVYHDRIRETLLATLSEAERRDVHLRLARALEAETPLDHEACSRHFLAAGDSARGALHARSAAEAAEGQLAFDRAARYYALCLEPRGLDRDAECSLRGRLANALSNSGRGAEAARQFSLAAEIADPDLSLSFQWRAAEEYLRSGHATQGIETSRSVVRKVGLRYPEHRASALFWGALRHTKNRYLASDARVRPPSADTERLLRQIDVCAGIALCIGYVAPVVSYYFQSLHVSLAFRAGERVRLCRALCTEATYAVMGGGNGERAAHLLARASALASEANDPKARGIVALSQGMTAFFLGNWQQAFERNAAADDLLRRECTGVQWELDTAMLYAMSSLHYTGRLKQLSERFRQLVEEAEARHDMYALTILHAGLSHVIHLAEDDPDQVLLALDSVMPAWPNEDLSVPRYWELLARFHVNLYRGTPSQALAEFRIRRQQIDRSLPMRVQVTRVRIASARARAMLAVAATGEDRAENVQGALENADLLDAESVTWSRALASSIRAGAAAVQGQSERAIGFLEQAERGFLDADMALEACVARRRRGELLKGAAGAELVLEADQWMAREAIRNPEAFARVLAPGYDPARRLF